MIRLFMIEDHNVTISGLRSFFRPSRDEINIAITANNIDEALQVDDSNSFDVIFLDLWLPTGKPADNYNLLEHKFPGKPIVIYTSEESNYWQRKMYNLGVKGFINKKEGKALIENTIKRVVQGETVYSTQFSDYMTKRAVSGYKNPNLGLTEDQHDLISSFIDGSDVKDIAQKMHKDISVINKELKKIRNIFGASNNVELVVKILSLKDWKSMDSNDNAKLNT